MARVTLTLQSNEEVPLKAEVDAAFGQIAADIETIAADIETLQGESVRSQTPVAKTDKFWPDVDTDAKIARWNNRLFIGDAANANGNRNGGQGGQWPSLPEQGPNWMVRDGSLVVTSSIGAQSIVGLTRRSDKPTPTEAGTTIAVSGYADGDVAGYSVWAGYFEAVRRYAGGNSFGLEIDAKNTGDNTQFTSYNAPTGAFALWLAAGGDPTYGGAATNPSAAAIAVVKNGHTWNAGIVFRQDALTGCDGVTGTANAIEMARGHQIIWRMAGNYAGTMLRSTVDDSASGHLVMFSNNNIDFYNAVSKRTFAVRHVAGGVNLLLVRQGTAGNPVELLANSDNAETSVGIRLRPLGAGILKIDGGDNANKLQISSAGIGFFNTSPVAKQTVGAALSTGGSETNANLATRINEIRAALVAYGLA
jgi:hypothetical protein